MFKKTNSNAHCVTKHKEKVVRIVALFRSIRANPGLEFVVANTLAKWKKLEPNEMDFSQGFSQKVVSRSYSLPASGYYCHLLITFANSLDPDQARQDVRPDLDPNCLTP